MSSNLQGSVHARVHKLDQRRSDKAIDHLAFFNSFGGNSGSQGPLVNILTQHSHISSFLNISL